ncbi:MAG: pyridoxal 5'-phosphate synthase, partial [Verrucomicrobia bacterium]|nr:pyridoxal 5'-phosphate synthase [Verrucomicrobiota bacterium]
AALTFYWPDWERQVCVRGRAERIPRDEAEAYFKTRPRGSQLAAWASNQCDVVADRAVLDAAWDAVAAKFPGAVALPPNWGGYVLNPEQIEFWQGRPNRLHDRFQFRKQADNSWKLDRLAP